MGVSGQCHRSPIVRDGVKHAATCWLVLVPVQISEQLSFIREWGGRFAPRTPELTLLWGRARRRSQGHLLHLERGPSA
jgi:hypothetical protein